MILFVIVRMQCRVLQKQTISMFVPQIISNPLFFGMRGLAVQSDTVVLFTVANCKTFKIGVKLFQPKSPTCWRVVIAPTQSPSSTYLRRKFKPIIVLNKFLPKSYGGFCGTLSGKVPLNPLFRTDISPKYVISLLFVKCKEVFSNICFLEKV